MKKTFALSFLLAMMICETSFAVDSMLVRQPAYHSMSFYVHKPVNVPRDFYVTYDGYLVYRNEQGIWHYGSAEKNGIIRTGYVVGSVIPSLVRLKPYNAKISSVAPVLNSPQSIVTGRPVDTNRIIYTPPESPLYPSTLRDAPSPDWTGNTNFMAIGKWQKSIDRIGVTSKPSIPVAWKGDYPEVIYAWTGMRWRQLDANGKHITALSTLRRELYDLTVEINKTNALHWTDDDSRVLSQYAYQWGYQWAGLIIPNGGIR